jgi:glycosyltransferase involved in cell wall biosynthesis
MEETHPAFSIIIPTYNRPNRLEACLKSLGQLNYPSARFEVIVVDDGSPIALEPVVDDFRAACNISFHRQESAGPAAARNTGARRAQGAFLAFTDDDCRPAPNWLRALAKQFRKTPTHLLGGRTVNALTQNPFSTASQLLVHYLYDHYNDGDNQARFFTSNNIALPTDRFHEIGGFDTTFMRAAAEDREFCDRWLHYGGSMTYVPEAVVRHAHSLDLAGFWRQHFNYGRGAFHFHEAHSRRDRDSIAPESLSFYWNLLRYPFSRYSGSWALAQMLLMGVSQVANASGFFYEMSVRNSEE